MTINAYAMISLAPHLFLRAVHRSDGLNEIIYQISCYSINTGRCFAESEAATFGEAVELIKNQLKIPQYVFDDLLVDLAWELLENRAR